MKIGSIIKNDIDFYLNKFENANIVCQTPGIGSIPTEKDYVITIELYNKKLWLSSGTSVLVYDISIDKIVFTEYISNGTTRGMGNYHRKSYHDVSKLTEEYMFQLSTVEKPLISIETMERLNKLYNKLYKVLKVDEQ